MCVFFFFHKGLTKAEFIYSINVALLYKNYYYYVSLSVTVRIHGCICVCIGKYVDAYVCVGYIHIHIFSEVCIFRYFHLLRLFISK